MPGGMNGMELARIVRERRPGVSVILTSANEPKTMPPGGRFVAKPYNTERLVELVCREAASACKRMGRAQKP